MKVTGNFPGSPCWVQLGTSDPQDAQRFYTEVFGWQTWPHDEYPMVGLADTMFGGAMETGEMFPPGTPAHWNPYFVVADVDASAAKARELGGEVVYGPEQVQMDKGPRIAIVTDPQGASFGIFKPAPTE